MARAATASTVTGRVRRLALGLVATAGLGAPALPAGAADVEAGQRKSQACAVCHGPLGLGSAPDAPHLAGQPPTYLVAQLRAFRSGKRQHEVMAVIAKPLSDTDIDDLAAWYGSFVIEIKGR